MAIRFSRIVVPVDFSINNEVAIEKALSLCDETNAVIHLVHVVKFDSVNIFSFHQYFANYFVTGNRYELSEARAKLEAIRQRIRKKKYHVDIFPWISFGSSVESVIIDKAIKLKADLVIVGKNSHHSWFPLLNTVVPSRIARQSGVPVLTVKPGSLHRDLKMVVVPIGMQFPTSKLAAINALRKKFRIHIRLVTFVSGNTQAAVLPGSLLNVYRILKTDSTSRISYDLLQGGNKAKAIYKYCKKVNADLMIVEPGAETRTGWFNTHISDMLPVQSKTQILAIQPD